MLWTLRQPLCRGLGSSNLRCQWRPCVNPKCLVARKLWGQSWLKSQQDIGQQAGAGLDGTHKQPSLRHAALLNPAQPSSFESSSTQIRLRGIVRSVRKQKRAIFASISDGSTLNPFQAFLAPDVKNVQAITNGAYVELLGKWQESRGQGQSHELMVDEISFIGESDPDVYPVQKQALTQDFLRTIPHLRMRSPFQSLITRARSQLIRGAHLLLDQEDPTGSRGATYVQPPVITSSDCEGAGEVFTIWPKNQSSNATSASNEQATDLYFREPKYLTVSSQLHLEAHAAELDRVWTLSPAFRAEESDTPRHLAEFSMLEVEMRLSAQSLSLDSVCAFLLELMRLLTVVLQESRVGKELLEYHARASGPTSESAAQGKKLDLEERWRRITDPWQFVTYTRAINALKDADAGDSKLFKYKPDWNKGLQLEHERWIVDVMCGGKPSLVFNYPKLLKPFYMLPSALTEETFSTDAEDQTSEQTMACFDLLLPYGYCEVAGGSLREHRLEPLIQNMREKGLLKRIAGHDSNYPFLQPGESLGTLQWYADLRRFGSSPHGGFGIGFDRLLAYLTGASNLRDVVGFPRAWGRADC